MFGPLMTIAGGFVGGFLVLRLGIIRMLLVASVIVMATNLCFLLLLQRPGDIEMLYFVIAMDNLAGGLATTAFIAFLSSLVNLKFTAMQYAIFSSLMTLFPKLLGGYSGAIVGHLDYAAFFILTACLCIPVFILIGLVQKYLQFEDE